ncbi:MAG: glycosyltransferase [Actinobacteria bacterium]|uniref:Unannotated protein n=1 Tax=freshwater metagenome TaxID=449393 RepID=A0A6J5ZHQ9_9ZZZZ|nr:glycosyltransferase [Actinomycetota bacterium]
MTLDIALPFYGDVGYLKAAVSSVLAQHDGRWRLLVVDDGYPDPEVGRWFAAITDPRVQYQRNATNLGANGNYKRCLELISSEYFMVMGADDILLPDYVGHVLELLEQHKEVGVIQPGVEVIDESGNVIDPIVDRIKRAIRLPQGVHHGQRAATSLVRGNWSYFPSLVWNTESVQALGFRAGLHVSQDLALLIDVLCEGSDLLVMDEVVFQYRRHTASDSSIKALNGARFAEESRLMKEMATLFRSHRWYRAALAARMHITSRLHAAVLIPKAIKHRKSPWALIKHVFGS